MKYLACQLTSERCEAELPTDWTPSGLNLTERDAYVVGKCTALLTCTHEFLSVPVGVELPSDWDDHTYVGSYLISVRRPDNGMDLTSVLVLHRVKPSVILIQGH